MISIHGYRFPNLINFSNWILWFSAQPSLKIVRFTGNGMSVKASGITASSADINKKKSQRKLCGFDMIIESTRWNNSYNRSQLKTKATYLTDV